MCEQHAIIGEKLVCLVMFDLYLYGMNIIIIILILELLIFYEQMSIVLLFYSYLKTIYLCWLSINKFEKQLTK